jgi:hypothetical protein
LFRIDCVNHRSVFFTMSAGLSSSETGAAQTQMPPTNDNSNDAGGETNPVESDPLPSDEVDEAIPESQQSAEGASNNSGKSTDWNTLSAECKGRRVLSRSADYNEEDHAAHLLIPPNQFNAFKNAAKPQGTVTGRNCLVEFHTDMSNADTGDVVWVWTHNLDSLEVVSLETVPMWTLGCIVELDKRTGRLYVAVGKVAGATAGERCEPFDKHGNLLYVHNLRCFFPSSDPTAIQNEKMETFRAHIQGLPPCTSRHKWPREMLLGYARAVPISADNMYETDLTLGSLAKLVAGAATEERTFVFLAMVMNQSEDNDPSVLLYPTNEKGDVRKNLPVRYTSQCISNCAFKFPLERYWVER